MPGERDFEEWEASESGDDELESFRSEIREKYKVPEAGEGANAAENVRKDAVEAIQQQSKRYLGQSETFEYGPEREREALLTKKRPESGAAQEEITDEPTEFRKRRTANELVSETSTNRDEDLWRPPEGDECDPKAASSRKLPAETEREADAVDGGANQATRNDREMRQPQEATSPERREESRPSIDVEGYVDQDSTSQDADKKENSQTSVSESRTEFGAESQYLELQASELQQLPEANSKGEPDPVAVQQGTNEKAESEEKYIASFEATAQRRTADGRTAFEVEVDSMEEQSGIKFREGSVYGITGNIDNVCDFRKVYFAGESEKMAIFAPSRLTDSIEYGEKYEVRVKSIDEISRTDEHLGVFYEAPYRVKGTEERVKFDVLLDTFEERTGFRFEEGKSYEVKGTIGDVTDFTLTHSRGEGKYLYITPPRAAAGLLEPGRKYEVTVLSIEERIEGKRRFEVSHTGKVTKLSLMVQALESAGIDVEAVRNADAGDRVLELNLRNLSHEGEEAKRLFAKVNASEGGVFMNIARAGGAQGDIVELEGAKRYQVGSFVDDFNSHRGRDLQNARLEVEGRNLSLDVDGRKYRFTDHSLDVHTMRVMLKGEVEGFKRGVCFIFDANEGTMVATARNNKRILAFESSETRGLVARYKLPESGGPSLEASHLDGRRWEMSEFIEKTDLIGERKPMEGSHAFEVDSTLLHYIQGRRKIPLNSRQEIGDVGEDLGAAVVTKLGWIEVERHPFDLRGPGRGCYLHGTDCLFRNPKTNELFLVEFRWWQDSRAADEKTLQIVRERRASEQNHEKWGEISGAYIAIVDLDKSSKIGELRVKRAW